MEHGMSLLLGQIAMWGMAGSLLGVLFCWVRYGGKGRKKVPLPSLGVGTGRRPPQGGSGTAPPKKDHLAECCAAKDQLIRERDGRIAKLEAGLEQMEALRVGYFDRERKLLDEVSSLKAVISAIRRDAGVEQVQTADASAEIMLRRRWGVVRHRYGKETWAIITEGCTTAESNVVRASAADTPSEALRKADEWWEKNVEKATESSGCTPVAAD